MADTCRVFKEPVRCAACGSRQYETMLRIAEGAPVTCVECQQDIDLPRDNSETFARVLTFVQSEQARCNSGRHNIRRSDRLMAGRLPPSLRIRLLVPR
jgi:hypothetical protein